MVSIFIPEAGPVWMTTPRIVVTRGHKRSKIKYIQGALSCNLNYEGMYSYDFWQNLFCCDRTLFLEIGNTGTFRKQKLRGYVVIGHAEKNQRAVCLWSALFKICLTGNKISNTFYIHLSLSKRKKIKICLNPRSGLIQ